MLLFVVAFSCNLFRSSFWFSFMFFFPMIHLPVGRARHRRNFFFGQSLFPFCFSFPEFLARTEPFWKAMERKLMICHSVFQVLLEDLNILIVTLSCLTISNVTVISSTCSSKFWALSLKLLLSELEFWNHHQPLVH